MEYDKKNLPSQEKEHAVSRILHLLRTGKGAQDEPDLEVTDALMEEVLAYITSMPQHDYEEFLADMVVVHAKPGFEEIVFNLQDKNRLSLIRFIVLVNNKTKDEGRVMPLLKIAAETVDAAGGFLLRRGDETINCTVETLLQDLKR